VGPLQGLLGTVIMVAALWVVAFYASKAGLIQTSAVYNATTNTTRNNTLTAVDCLQLATLLCSTDTVVVLSMLDPASYPLLYAVLSGEGILNDAITISLFRGIESFKGQDELTSANFAWLRCFCFGSS
jgi:NhaP-type Na+/H+ or K+/H+ antiporter